MKSMDRNSSLLRLKLDLVYRDLAMEEAQKRFDELNVPTADVSAPVESAPLPTPVKTKKVIRALVPAGPPSAGSLAAKAAYAALPEDVKAARVTAMKEGKAKKADASKAVLPAGK